MAVGAPARNLFQSGQKYIFGMYALSLQSPRARLLTVLVTQCAEIVQPRLRVTFAKDELECVLKFPWSCRLRFLTPSLWNNSVNTQIIPVQTMAILMP